MEHRNTYIHLIDHFWKLHSHNTNKGVYKVEESSNNDLGYVIRKHKNQDITVIATKQSKHSIGFTQSGLCRYNAACIVQSASNLHAMQRK